MTTPHDPTKLPLTPHKGTDSTEQPGYVDGIPVAELVRAARELTNRITNEDRQRLAFDLNESGHQRSIQSGAPYLIQGWFTGKLDLDTELNRRFPTPPLLSNMTFAPRPGQYRKHGFAQFASQDAASVMTMEIHNNTGALEVSFLHFSMIGVRFTLGAITEQQQKRFLELIERQNGIVFLWTRERWERDYLIFVIRERFARMYAFGPGRVEGACRLTPDGLTQLRQWLGGFWAGQPQESAPVPSVAATSTVPPPDTPPSTPPPTPPPSPTPTEKNPFNW
jgi:hypothetical protein